MKCYSRHGSYCKIQALEQFISFFRNQSSCLGAEKPQFVFGVLAWKTLYLKKIADRPTNTANSWVACPYQFQAYYSITHYRHKIWKKHCEFLGCDCRKATNGPSKDNGDGSLARLLMIFTNAWFSQNLEGGYKPLFTGHTICLKNLCKRVFGSIKPLYQAHGFYHRALSKSVERAQTALSKSMWMLQWKKNAFLNIISWSHSWSFPLQAVNVCWSVSPSISPYH